MGDRMVVETDPRSNSKKTDPYCGIVKISMSVSRKLETISQKKFQNMCHFLNEGVGVNELLSAINITSILCSDLEIQFILILRNSEFCYP